MAEYFLSAHTRMICVASRCSSLVAGDSVPQRFWRRYGSGSGLAEDPVVRDARPDTLATRRSPSSSRTRLSALDDDQLRLYRTRMAEFLEPDRLPDGRFEMVQRARMTVARKQ